MIRASGTFSASRSSSRSASPAGPLGPDATAVLGRLRDLAGVPQLELLRRLGSSPKGLTEADAVGRLAGCGDNQVAPAARTSVATRMVAALRSPFVGLLAGLGVIFAVLGDPRGALTVAVMVALSVAVRLWQHTRSERAVAALREHVSVTATVRRRARPGQPPTSREVPSQDVVPGDVLQLGPGDLVPADACLLAARDLVVDQSTLSGESLPVPKHPAGQHHPEGPARRRGYHHSHRGADRQGDRHGTGPDVVDSPSLCFAGTSVVSGSATGVVIATGAHTYAGVIARHTARAGRPESSFDHGVRMVGATLIRFMLVLVPIVLAVNGAVSGDWARAVMFAVAVAVGLTPEMLPVRS